MWLRLHSYWTGLDERADGEAGGLEVGANFLCHGDKVKRVDTSSVAINEGSAKPTLMSRSSGYYASDQRMTEFPSELPGKVIQDGSSRKTHYRTIHTWI